MARTQATRVYSETNSVRTAIELCHNEGRMTLGTAAGQCSVGYTCSNLIQGSKQDGSAACSTSVPVTGVPQVDNNPMKTEVKLTATFSSTSSSQLRGKTIELTRDDGGNWTCVANIPAKFKPSGCS
ncbi:MAG: pilin [Zoogloeaceae bacterium]|nr:pilin [Zoogloeaceae bacterium]